MDTHKPKHLVTVEHKNLMVETENFTCKVLSLDVSPMKPTINLSKFYSLNFCAVRYQGVLIFQVSLCTKGLI